MPPSPRNADGLFAEILGAPDRDHCPGANPVVSFRDDDEAEFLTEIERHAGVRVVLHRRGIFHGNLAQVEGEDWIADQRMPRDAVIAQRWHEAKPILLRGAVQPREELGDVLAERRRLHDELKEPGGLRGFLKRRREELEPQFQVQGKPGRLFDEERDVERVMLTWRLDPDDPSSPRMKDLWLKSAWLSTRDDDESLRLRFSFGREEVDDASRDVRRHRRVTELAEILLPECALVHANEALRGLVDGQCGGATFFTQHIAYWNAPDGGALFHHDAFAGDAVGGQRGVCYLQLTGSTAWLALSIEDLARRVIEFGEYLAEGELRWVREQAFRRPGSYERFAKLLLRFKRVVRELARPGCGSLGRIVNRGPEFTAFLADAGHALLLFPGDVLLLPNHGYERTAMHSVFCASDEPGYALSMAIREVDPPPPPQLDEVESVQLEGAPRRGRPDRRRPRR